MLGLNGNCQTSVLQSLASPGPEPCCSHGAPAWQPWPHAASSPSHLQGRPPLFLRTPPSPSIVLHPRLPPASTWPTPGLPETEDRPRPEGTSFRGLPMHLKGSDPVGRGHGPQGRPRGRWGSPGLPLPRLRRQWAGRACLLSSPSHARVLTPARPKSHRFEAG